MNRSPWAEMLKEYVNKSLYPTTNHKSGAAGYVIIDASAIVTPLQKEMHVDEIRGLPHFSTCSDPAINEILCEDLPSTHTVKGYQPDQIKPELFFKRIRDW